MALKLKELCGCEKLFCVGDHANDLPMLLAADRGFAPANAIEEVRSSGVQVVCHCLDGAIADVVEAGFQHSNHVFLRHPVQTPTTLFHQLKESLLCVLI